MQFIDLGLDSEFEEHSENLCGSVSRLARVITVDRERFRPNTDIHL